MNKKAVIAVLVTLLLPVTCYFIIRHYSDKALAMPRRYYPDQIVDTLKKGKMVQDTIWHTITDFSLTNQLGQQVTLDKYKGKILIIDFFFTHCPTICPPLAKNMQRLQQSINNAQKVGDQVNHDIQFASFSIDPERDSVPRLKAWADRFQIDPVQWDLLTGDKKQIYNLALNDLKVGLVDGKAVDTDFVHTDHFILIDSSGVVRGYYHGLDENDLKKLAQDAVLLTLEKSPNERNSLADNLDILAIAFLIAAVFAGLFLIIFKKKKNVDLHVDKE